MQHTGKNCYPTPPPINLSPFQCCTYLSTHNFSFINCFVATVSNLLSTLCECTLMGTDLVECMEEFMVRAGLYTHEPQNTGGILHLEQTILELCSNPKVTQGLFYMLPIYTDNKLFIRYTSSKPNNCNNKPIIFSVYMFVYPNIMYNFLNIYFKVH